MSLIAATLPDSAIVVIVTLTGGAIGALWAGLRICFKRILETADAGDQKTAKVQAQLDELENDLANCDVVDCGARRIRRRRQEQADRAGSGPNPPPPRHTGPPFPRHMRGTDPLSS